MTSKIHPIRIPFQLPVNEQRKVDRIVYSYVVTGEELCLVDTGPVGGEHFIVSALSEMGLSEKDVKRVINTHEHPDHVGGNTFFKETAQPRFACHAKAVRWIQSLENQFKELIRNGADLSAEKKEELKSINQKLSKLKVQFNQNLLAETNKYKIVIEDK